MFKSAIASTFFLGSSALLSNSSPDEIKKMWDDFKVTHGKSYRTQDEEVMRFNVFVENFGLVDERNRVERANGGTAFHGITQFSDLTQSEFEKGYLTADAARGLTNGTAIRDENIKPYEGPQGLVDWSGKYTTPVRDQGYCGYDLMNWFRKHNNSRLIVGRAGLFQLQNKSSPMLFERPAGVRLFFPPNNLSTVTLSQADAMEVGLRMPILTCNELEEFTPTRLIPTEAMAALARLTVLSSKWQ
jgi:hypothetical protein